MTSLTLVLAISATILIQITFFLCLGFWRHWQAYQALKSGAAESNITFNPAASPAVHAAAWDGYRTFRVERKVQEDKSGQVCSFYLVPDDQKPLPPFLPGQFLTFQLDTPSAHGGSPTVVRCYSLSDAPQARSYRVSVKRAPAPLGIQVPPGVSSNYFHDHVEVGHKLQVRAPAGHFYIDHSDAPVVLVGGGIGITPMLSMLNWCLSAQPGREVWLFYGVRNSAELVMQAHLNDLAVHHQNFHLHLCFSNPLSGDLEINQAGPVHRHHSRIDVGLLRRLLPLTPYHYYICGPTPLLQSLVPALEDWGVLSGRIHFEAFGPASIPRKNSAPAPLSTAMNSERQAAVMVTFAKSGKTLAWEPGMGSLLDFAEGRGIAVSSGCRSGSCGSCQTSIRSGEVAYTQSPDFDPELGSCLLCVCTPKTAVTLDV